MVPVKAQLNIDCEDQYELIDSVHLEPAFIELSGGTDEIAKIDTLYTVPMNLKHVKSSLLLKLNLQNSSQLKQIRTNVTSVQAAVGVAKYTEASMELPVEAQNLPAGYGLKTFPDKVTVKYKVRFEDYNKIDPSMFSAVVDYLKIEPGVNKLKVSLAKWPELVRAPKLSEERVEYIIRK
jgi:YbbR domain-containing protein